MPCSEKYANCSPFRISRFSFSFGELNFSGLPDGKDPDAFLERMVVADRENLFSISGVSKGPFDMYKPKPINPHKTKVTRLTDLNLQFIYQGR